MTQTNEFFLVKDLQYKTNKDVLFKKVPNKYTL